jgi:hypothetical protein
MMTASDALWSGLPCAADQIFEACELLGTHRATGMQPACRNANFSTHAKLTAIGELR